MKVQDRGDYAKITDNTGKLYIPLAKSSTGRKPCKRFFRKAAAAQDYSREVTLRYERLKAYVRNQNTD